MLDTSKAAVYHIMQRIESIGASVKNINKQIGTMSLHFVENSEDGIIDRENLIRYKMFSIDQRHSLKNIENELKHVLDIHYETADIVMVAATPILVKSVARISRELRKTEHFLGIFEQTLIKYDVYEDGLNRPSF